MSESGLGVELQFAVFDALGRGGPFGLAVVDLEFRVLEINPVLVAWHGIPREAHIGQTVQSIVPDFWSVLEPLFRRVRDGVSVLQQEVSGAMACAPHLIRHWLISGHPVWTQDTVSALAIVVEDITDQRRVEHALRVRTDLYGMLSRTHRAINDNRSAQPLYRDICSIAIEVGHFQLAWVGVPDGDHLRAVAWAGPGSGYLNDLFISLKDDDPRSKGPTGRAAMAGDTVVINDYPAAPMTAPWHAMAARYGFRASAAFPLRERGHVVAVLTLYASVAGFFNDALLATLGEMTASISHGLDRLLLEQERRRDEAALYLRDRAMQAVSQGICISDAQRPGRPLIYVSPGFEKLTGYTAHEAVGRGCRMLQGPDSDPEMIATMRAAQREGRVCSIELQNYRKDGTRFWNNVTIAPVRDEHGTVVNFVAVQVDVTERRRMEYQLRQAQKLEAIGLLAGGIAHDFNNLLTVMNGYAALMLSRMSSTDPARSSLLEIHNAGERAANLTRQLLAYSRQHILERQILHLNDVALSVERMLARLIGEDIVLSLRAGPALWSVRADRGQLEQIIINLAINARDAMPRGGEVVIAMRNFSHFDLEDGKVASLPRGDYVELSVSDNGTGMDDDTRLHMFDPFYTTKAEGKGTGMGLATVLGIVKQSDGYIFVDSALGVGTTMRIYLPRSSEQSTTQESDQTSDLPRGTATILLAEDEQALRVLSRHILEACGYKVLEAADGRSALDVADAFEGAIDLLVSDVVMPQLNGRELADELRQRRPNCRCLLLSGYTEDAMLRSGVATASYEFLAKPFTPHALATKVYNLLAARA